MIERSQLKKLLGFVNAIVDKKITRDVLRKGLLVAFTASDAEKYRVKVPGKPQRQMYLRVKFSFDKEGVATGVDNIVYLGVNPKGKGRARRPTEELYRLIHDRTALTML